jgi:hypothetical protein
MAPPAAYFDSTFITRLCNWWSPSTTARERWRRRLYLFKYFWVRFGLIIRSDNRLQPVTIAESFTRFVAIDACYTWKLGVGGAHGWLAKLDAAVSTISSQNIIKTSPGMRRHHVP